MAKKNPLDSLSDYTDQSVARMLAAELSGRIAYTTGLGWLTYRGHVWERDPDGTRVQGILFDFMAAHVPPLMRTATGPMMGQLAGLMSQRRTETLTKAMRSMGPVRVEVAGWDSDPHLLNTPGGVVDLRTGRISRNNPALRMTRSTSVAYRPGATHPDWVEALACQRDEASRSWMQAALGSGCWGVQRGDFLGLLTGHGANGKSTVTGAAVAALGTYADLVDRSVILADGHSEFKMELRGLRLAVVEELAEGHHLNMAEIKALFGSGQIKSRHLYQPAVSFPAQFTMMVATNYKPLVPDTDHGTWRRLVRLDFPEKYEGDELDLGLRPRLQAEEAQREAVLAWLIEGAMMEMPAPSELMAASLADWRDESDPLADFVTERVTFDSQHWAPRGDFYRAFLEVLDEAGGREWSARTFWDRLRAHPLWQDLMSSGHVEEGKGGAKGDTRGFHGLRVASVSAFGTY